MRRALTTTPWPVALLAWSFLCPTEFSLYVADLRLPPHRVALLIMLPFALARLCVRSDVRIRAFDILLLLYSAVTVLAYSLHTEGSEGLVYGGSQGLESFGAYVIVRAYVRDAATCMATLRVLLATVVAALVFALPETVLGQTFTHDVLQSLTGYQHPRGIEQRLGLTRAYGTFDHPIHLGTYCASLLAVLWLSSPRTRRGLAVACLLVLATFTALSSAPMLCLALQAAFLLGERLTRGVPFRVPIAIAIFAGLFVGASLVSNRGPIAVIATSLTLDSWTGYYRLMIWTYGAETVIEFPWFGIGLGDWKRPDWMASASVDAFWLLIAMRTGLPSLLLLLSAMALLAIGVGRRGRRHADPWARRFARGWLISLFALTLVGCTVHYWNVLYCYFFFVLALAAWVADPLPVRRVRASRRWPDTAMLRSTLRPLPPPVPA